VPSWLTRASSSGPGRARQSPISLSGGTLHRWPADGAHTGKNFYANSVPTYASDPLSGPTFGPSRRLWDRACWPCEKMWPYQHRHSGALVRHSDAPGIPYPQKYRFAHARHSPCVSSSSSSIPHQTIISLSLYRANGDTQRRCCVGTFADTTSIAHENLSHSARSSRRPTGQSGRRITVSIHLGHSAPQIPAHSIAARFP
jgi:hypothetical protein